ERPKLEARADLDATVAQRLRLIDLFDPIEYDSTDFTSYDPTSDKESPYRRALKRFKAHGREEILPANYTYNLISNSLALTVETAAIPVHRQLLAEADLLASDESEGKSAVLYPENQELLKAAEKGITERLWAAWYYLKHRYDEVEIRSDQRLSAEFIDLGQ